MKFASGPAGERRNAPAAGPAAAGLTGAFGMKLFTGSLAAGLVAAGGRRAGAGAGPYEAGVRHTRRRRTSMLRRLPRRCRTANPGRATDTARACCRRRRSMPCSAITASRRSASPGSAASSTRSRCHRSRRRGRPADYRRAQWPDHPLPAGLPHGRRQLLRSERSHGPSWLSRRQVRSQQAHRRRTMVRPTAPSRPAPQVASRTVPMPKANPLAAKPAARAGQAGGRARAKAGRGARRPPRP